MKILITGSSGLIGTALTRSFLGDGYEVAGLLRTRVDGQPYWNIENGVIDLGRFGAPNVVINLAGENLTDSRWSQAKKARIVNSRIKGTQLLVDYFVNAEQKPDLLISGSAVGFYGNRGDELVDESSKPGTGFAAELCQQWEAATEPTKQAGIRVVNIRTGIVLSTAGGALKKMLLPFKLGLGGTLGNGQQFVSWVSIDDMVDMVKFIMNHEAISGPVNMVSPEPVTNYQLTKALGSALHRPTIFPMPAFVASLIFGDMADELLLSSTRVKPTKLKQAGYQFHHTDLFETIESLIKDVRPL